MAEAAASVAFIGFHATGKSTYLGAFWQIVQDDRDLTVVEGDYTGDRSHLQFIGEEVSAGNRLERTDVDSSDGFRVHVQFAGGHDVFLDVPDLSGEGLRIVVEERVWKPELAKAVMQADAILFFLSPPRVRMPVRSAFTDEFLASLLDGDDDADDDDLDDAQGDGDDSIVSTSKEVDFESRLACTAAHVVDAIENVLALRSEIGSTRIGFVISAWDSVDQNLSPAAWLQKRLPALPALADVNRDRLEMTVFGVSAQGGSLPGERDALLAKGRVLDRAFARDAAGTSVPFSAPMRWAILRD